MGLSALLPLLLAAVTGAAAADDPDTPVTVTGDEAAALVKPYLGAWVAFETVQPSPDAPPYPLERHILLRLQNGRLRVKTYDYLPEKKVRSRESNWDGTIHEDQWNVTRQTLTPMSDGTLSIGLGGTNGIGPAALKTSWWAAGTMEILEGEDGPVLHYYTDQGYAPSSKGNIWQPIDRTYRLVSRQIDPEFLGRRP